MDDDTLVERLNSLGRLAEVNVAAGTPNTGMNEITHEEADRIIESVIGAGATLAQVKALLEGQRVFAAYRAPLLRAVAWRDAHPQR